MEIVVLLAAEPYSLKRRLCRKKTASSERGNFDDIFEISAVAEETQGDESSRSSHAGGLSL